MKATIKINNENIEFDYNKVIEADNSPIDYEAIETFKREIKMFTTMKGASKCKRKITKF